MVGVGLQGGSHVENFLKIPGCRITAVCDVRAGADGLGRAGHHRRGTSGAHRLHAGPARLRAAVRDRGRGPGVHRHAVGMARAGDAGGDEERQARRHRSAGGDDAGRLLGARRVRGEASAPRRDDGELQLRPRRDDGLQHRPAGRARRDAARRRRLSARPARDQVREEGRGAVAARLVDEDSTAIPTRPTGSGRSPTVSTSIAAIASTTWSR